MDLIQNPTDDQVALMGCVVAFLASAALMYVSAYLNRGRQQTRPSNQTLPLPERTEVSPRKVA